jgi:CubicO group peptidase (beta-lactamase class C family)
MKQLILTLSIILCLPIFGQKQASEIKLDRQKIKYVDKVILQSIEKNEIPGAVICVVSSEKILYKKAYGNRQVFPKVEKMTTNTIFDLASMTKPIATATSIILLAERGQLRLTDPVSMYIPDFNKKIQIIHLLTHLSGLPPYPPVKQVKSDMNKNQDALMQYILKCKKQSKPGKDFTYSCLNYIALQKIIETVTGNSLSDFTKKNIFDHLGMKNTMFCPDTKKLKLIAPTEMQDDNSVLRGIVHDPLARELKDGISGNAGLFSNADDMAKFAMAMLNNGALNGNRILSPLSVNVLTTVPDKYSEFGRTPGWDNSSAYSSCKGDFLSEHTYSHTGYTGTSIVIDPDTGIAIILLTNRVHPYDKSSTTQLRALVSNAVAGAITK